MGLEKRLIVTSAAKSTGRLYAEVTLPLIEKYAQKCDADMLMINTENKKKYDYLTYQKWDYPSYLSIYDRILHIDIDMVVRSTTPNLFERVGEYDFAGVDELPFENLKQENPPVSRYDDLRKFESKLDTKHCILPTFYINAGLFLFGRTHRNVFNSIPLDGDNCYFREQTHINYNLHAIGHKIHLLNPKFNFMKLMQDAGLDKETAHIIHYAGSWGGLQPDEVVKMMKEDIR